jgi:hypothetical protein
MSGVPQAFIGLQFFSAEGALWTAAIVAVAFVGSIAVAALLLIHLPATYFLDDAAPTWWDHGHPILRWTVFILKNVVGAVLVGAGILMIFTPGQGVLTILIGVMLLDFPGKRQLERKLISRPKVLRAINGLRARFGKPPVVLHRDTANDKSNVG